MFTAVFVFTIWIIDLIIDLGLDWNDPDHWTMCAGMYMIARFIWRVLYKDDLL